MMLLVFLTSISTLPRTPELRIYEVRPTIVQFVIGYLGKDGMSLMTICEKHSWLEGMCIRNLVYDRKDIRYTAKTTHYWTKIVWTCWQQSWNWCQKGWKIPRAGAAPPLVYPVLFLLRLPTWAWKPLLIALTDRLLPHDSQAMKKIRFSFVSRVSNDLQVLQVTYSTIVWILMECNEWRWSEVI